MKEKLLSWLVDTAYAAALALIVAFIACNGCLPVFGGLAFIFFAIFKAWIHVTPKRKKRS
jgi:hypothetical protein